MDDEQRALLRKAAEALKGKRLVVEHGAAGSVSIRAVDSEEHPSTGLQCSFCGKKESQVRKLIAGPTVYICNECVTLCSKILRQEGIA